MTSNSDSSDVDIQIVCLQEALSISNRLKELLSKVESEKLEALRKCSQLQEQIEKLKSEKCANCSALLVKLSMEKKEKERLKKDEKAKLVKRIAKMLENLDEPNTNQGTNAHQLFTELVCGGLDDSGPEQKVSKVKKNITLMQDSDCSEEESNSRILVNETIVAIDSEESSNDFNVKHTREVIVPETEPVNIARTHPERNAKYSRSAKAQSRSGDGNDQIDCLFENQTLPKKENEIQPQTKKLKRSPVLSLKSTNINENIKEKLPNRSSPLQVDIVEETTIKNHSAKSPSVLSEAMDSLEACSSLRTNGSNHLPDEKDILWKMKPSVLLENNSGAAGGKKLKQMTLGLARAEKKHDISMSQGFKGGVADAKKSDDVKDVVLPSPEQVTKWNFSKKTQSCGTLEDPDMTIFQPGMTSTCLPANTSFDSLPKPCKSPPYKYRRDTVRKREERLKLPGQDCDQCAKYYKAAGLDKTQDLQSRMNSCSRHRDKYQIRANTPPGFWDPVFSVSPNGSQENQL